MPAQATVPTFTVLVSDSVDGVTATVPTYEFQSDDPTIADLEDQVESVRVIGLKVELLLVIQLGLGPHEFDSVAWIAPAKVTPGKVELASTQPSDEKLLVLLLLLPEEALSVNVPVVVRADVTPISTPPVRLLSASNLLKDNKLSWEV